MMKYASVLAMLLIAACNPGKKDYQLEAHCQGLGLKPGTAEYDKCISEKKTQRMLEQQREEFERMKQDERDWKMHQSNY